MQERFLKDKDGNKYSYNPQIPEIIREDGNDATPVPPRNTLTAEESNVFITSVLPESAKNTIEVKSIDDVLNNPALEAWCPASFWDNLKKEDFLKIIKTSKCANSLLLHFSNEKLWAIDGYYALLEHKREDMLEGVLKKQRLTFTPDNWVSLLTHQKDGEANIFFKYCPVELLKEFTSDHWQNLLLSAPDFYLQNDRANSYLTKTKNIPVTFWIENICANKPKLRPEHFPKNITIKPEFFNTIFDQPQPNLALFKPELNLVKDDALKNLEPAKWLELFDKNPQVIQIPPPKTIKPYLGSKFCRNRSAVFGAVFFLIAAICAGGNVWSIIIGTIIAGLLSKMLCRALTSKLYLNKIQSICIAIMTGAASSACLVSSLLLPSAWGIVIYPLFTLFCFCIFHLIRCRKRSVYCAESKKGYLYLSAPALSIIISGAAAAIIFSDFATEKHIQQTAHNFARMHFSKPEQYFMQNSFDRSEKSQKHLHDFEEALKDKKINSCLDAFEKLAGFWNKNPRLSVWAADSIKLLEELRFSGSGSVSQITRGKKLLSSYAGENKRALEKLESSFKEESQKSLIAFGEYFDKNFPPPKSIVRSDAANLAKIADVYCAFPDIFNQQQRLKFGWYIALKSRKEALPILTGDKESMAYFFAALMEHGIHPEDFTVRKQPAIFRSVTATSPVSGEKFFNFLLEHNFEPETVMYLLALSQKIQKNKKYVSTLETAILKGYPDKNGYYLAWNKDSRDQKIPVLERIIQDQTPGKETAALNVADKSFKRGNYQKSYLFYKKFNDLGGRELSDDHIEQMNTAYYKINQTQIAKSINNFISEFDRTYSDKTSAQPPIDFEYERCLNFLEQKFLWRYCYAMYQNPRALREKAAKIKDMAIRKLRTIKSPEAQYLLAKMEKSGSVLPKDAISIGTQAEFQKIKLEAVRLQIHDNRFAVNDRIKGIMVLFDAGELSVSDKLRAGRFLIEQNKNADARKIINSLPDSGEKYYELFRSCLADKDFSNARNNLSIALRKKHPVSFEDYRKVFPETDIDHLTLVIANKGKDHKAAALTLARHMIEKKNLSGAVRYYRLAGKESLKPDDELEFALALWEIGTETPEEKKYALRNCMNLPEERITANLAFDLYNFLFSENPDHADKWLKTASDKGHHEAQEKRYMQLRNDNTKDFQIQLEKNALWKICAGRGVVIAVTDAVKALFDEKACPIDIKDVIRAADELPPAELKKIKEKLDFIKSM